ncbi:hypothetical protein BJ878DRAFT_486414 [Calycina marina]|uniref:Uncharacterized protein n=1 Tax=Calycina marina TaxID=1763456 RepID=A0A9P8CKS7_9HELO|nr:hypothetical protein BJ878DRAFT_486414 [Calycina marina]
MMVSRSFLPKRLSILAIWSRSSACHRLKAHLGLLLSGESHQWGGPKGMTEFRDLEETVDGYVQEVLRQTKNALTHASGIGDPLTRSTR